MCHLACMCCISAGLLFEGSQQYPPCPNVERNQQDQAEWLILFNYEESPVLILVADEEQDFWAILQPENES
ncbi:hypothetical protein QJS10_CPA10g01991 [Acorus calamus]|uniref:Uncharacterized protein n=1 Tax=Acorus calamus TaxID=4465 RepID=A0AAV9E0R8_ACOCL|nr:hypothetical protein QJS10_CPA10g01991 [Acorus calamus]